MPAPRNIRFSHNWNGKLHCKAFTTIRLHDDTKYIVGEIYDVYLTSKAADVPNQFMGRAELTAKKTFRMDQLNEWIAWLDTGYDLDTTRQIIRRMYPKLENALLDLCLFVKKK